MSSAKQFYFQLMHKASFCVSKCFGHLSWPLSGSYCITQRQLLICQWIVNVYIPVIWSFHREVHVDEKCVLLGYYAASSGNSLPTFRDNLSVPKRRWGINTPRCVINQKSAVVICTSALSTINWCTVLFKVIQIRAQVKYENVKCKNALLLHFYYNLNNFSHTVHQSAVA